MQREHKTKRKRRASTKRKNVRKCSLQIRDVPDSVFRMDSDGRKWRSQATLRAKLAHYLATFANPDGSHIGIGVERMSARLQVSRRTTFELLNDLRYLGFLVDGSKTKFRGTRWRTLNATAILSKAEECAQNAQTELQRCEIGSPIVRDSPFKGARLTANGARLARKTGESRTQPCLPCSDRSASEVSRGQGTDGCANAHARDFASPVLDDEEQDQTEPAIDADTFERLKNIVEEQAGAFGFEFGIDAEEDRRTYGRIRTIWGETNFDNAYDIAERIRFFEEAFLQASMHAQDVTGLFVLANKFFTATSLYD